MDSNLGQKFEQMCARAACETININRLESERVRMRKTSDKGTDIALTLPQGSHLRHGDVIMLTEDKMVIVEIEPENVAIVEIKDNIRDGDDIIKVPVIIGHTIGNLHRPIKLEENRIYFPIQADSEIDMFKKLFASVNEHIEIKNTKMVFEPDEGMSIHEH
ncbi:MAG: urease accessory protein UreE [Nitrososphaeraceae archaeon]